MRVEVRLYATLRRHLPQARAGESYEIELEEGATVENLLEALGVPVDGTKQAFVNGITRELDHQLRDGDKVGVFPPIGGGGA